MNNGRRCYQKFKSKARILRKNGWTHREIGKEFGVAFSTVYYWTKGITLTSEQKKAIEIRRNRTTSNFSIEERRALARKNFSTYWKKPYSKKELLVKIQQFHLKNGRIPLKREFNMYREYQQRFGSWNKAISAAGFEPNPVIFSKKFVAKDGHICDSFAEKIIDDWLSKRQISHRKNFFYQNTKMTADFSSGNIRLEYFGLAGENKLYDQIIRKKRKFCQKENLKLIEIYPSDLFPNRLSEIINLKELK